MPFQTIMLVAPILLSNTPLFPSSVEVKIEPTLYQSLVSSADALTLCQAGRTAQAAPIRGAVMQVRNAINSQLQAVNIEAWVKSTVAWQCVPIPGSVTAQDPVVLQYGFTGTITDVSLSSAASITRLLNTFPNEFNTVAECEAASAAVEEFTTSTAPSTGATKYPIPAMMKALVPSSTGVFAYGHLCTLRSAM